VDNDVSTRHDMNRTWQE